MFQMFIGKQAFGVAAVLANLSKQKAFSHLGNKCPSCTQQKETTAHLLFCSEVGREQNLQAQLGVVGDWMHSAGTVPELAHLIMNFLRTRGTMERGGREIYASATYTPFLRSQCHIGWRRTMEGMISRTLLELHHYDLLLPHSRLTTQAWAQSLTQKLIEATHGVWIYRNLTIHDRLSGLVATKTKEQLLQEIEAQIEQGGGSLEEQDKWMLEINTDNLSTSSDEKESYWLIAIQSARARFRIRQTHNS
jgi:hypothetical protein